MNTSDVTVRFAPSPTGYVHVGSLRTALYNYLFARHNNGKFILRIEDTDQDRFVEGAVDNLLNMLKWAGLDYDEGPEKENGSDSYYQSKRLGIYQKHIQILMDKGDAYPCFCSSERLDKMRSDQLARGEDARYDGMCRSIVPDEARKRMNNEAHVIRMKIPVGETIIVDDIVRGKVSFQTDVLDDQVLIKSDGFPTYHFANVVDDYLMGISHVIRGEEWLPSTPKHILLYNMFDWKIPLFAHLPLLLNADRSKLSKRQGDVAVEDYRDKGILPQALVNFVALLGWNKGDDQEIFSLSELCESFSLERVTKAGAVFDLNKLNWMNGQYVRQMSEDEYLEMGRNWLTKLNLESGDQEKDKLILLSVRNHLNRFDELADTVSIFFKEELDYTDDALEWIKKEKSITIFEKMQEHLKKFSDLTLDNFKELMKNVQKETGIKGKDLWMPVRAAITGQVAGPELPAVITVVGKERVEAFLKQTMKIGKTK
ncbi:MAG: glutamate--tRNA ligase [Calditrichaceae bacterium]